MKTPEEIAREIANGAVKFDWNTGSAGFHTRRAMIQAYIFNVPVRLIPGENEDAVVAKFEKWAEPIRGRIATTLAVLVHAAISEERKRATFTDPIAFDVDAISAERSAGTVPPAPEPEEVDRIARKAFEDYAAGRTDSRGNPKPAPACARCGGSGEIVAHASAVRNPGGGIERIVRRFEPCPECRGTP